MNKQEILDNVLIGIITFLFIFLIMMSLNVMGGDYTLIGGLLLLITFVSWGIFLNWMRVF